MKLLVSLLIALLCFHSCSHGKKSRDLSSVESKEQSCLFLTQKILSQSVEVRREHLKKKFTSFNYIKEADNKEFQKLAINSQSDRKGISFIHLENTVLKELNDIVLKDKELSYGVIILYQELFYKEVMKSLKSKGLSHLLKGKYADFKSIRMAIKTSSDFSTLDIQKLLKGASLKVEHDFKRNINFFFYDYDFKKFSIESLDNLESWHTLGIGRSADRASIASRFQRENNILIKPPTFRQMRTLFERRVRRARKSQKVLRTDQRLKRLFIFDKEANKSILSFEFSRFLKKSDLSSSSGLKDFTQSIQKNFKIELTYSQLVHLRNYKNFISSLIPSIYQNQTKAWSFHLAKRGILSVDLADIGAKGLHNTIKAFNRKVRPDAIIEEARKYYFRVDGSIKRARKWVHALSPDAQMISSGDDILLFPSYSMNKKIKVDYLRRLIRKNDPDQLRSVHIPAVYGDTRNSIPEQGYSSIITAAENFTKRLRQEISQRIGPRYSHNIAILADLSPMQNNNDIIMNIFYIHKTNDLRSSELLEISKEILIEFPQYKNIFFKEVINE